MTVWLSPAMPLTSNGDGFKLVVACEIVVIDTLTMDGYSVPIDRLPLPVHNHFEIITHLSMTRARQIPTTFDVLNMLIP